MEKKRLRDYWGDIVRNLIQYKSRSVIVRVSALVLLAVLLPFLLVTTMVKMEMEAVVKEEIKVANERTLDAIGTSLDNVMDRMFSLSMHLIDSSDLSGLYIMDWDSALARYGTVLEEKIHINFLMEEYIDSVYIYLSEKGKVLSFEKRNNGNENAAAGRDDGYILEALV